MQGVLTYISAVGPTQGSISGLFWVGRPDDVPVFLNGSVAFENHDHDGAAAHEFRQLVEEGALAVDGVETARLAERQMQALERRDLEAFFLEALDDGADFVLLDGVGFDD